MTYTLKQKLGAVIHDLPSYLKGIRPVSRSSKVGTPWLFIRNRNERLTPDGRRIGVRCDWQWTSDLHIARVFPGLGLSLMKRALRDWPVVLRQSPSLQRERVEVSFVVGHRGRARLPHLLTTLQSISGQRHPSFECIVIEQSEEPEAREFVPQWVRYAHVPAPDPDTPYCRSRAFNVGASMARGEMLVLHDNDLLVPRDYAAEVSARHREGYEVVNLKRFIFYLTEAHSQKISGAKEFALDEAPESVMQNAQGGGSLAIAREAYLALGGFDESFVGWGGEDNEFWERAQTRSVWPYGYLPMVHLWHAPQPDKLDKRRRTVEHFEALSAVPVEKRIEELRELNFGSLKSLSFAVEPVGAAREA